MEYWSIGGLEIWWNGGLVAEIGLFFWFCAPKPKGKDKRGQSTILDSEN
jgi:hypothetical protein